MQQTSLPQWAKVNCDICNQANKHHRYHTLKCDLDEPEEHVSDFLEESTGVSSTVKDTHKQDWLRIAMTSHWKGIEIKFTAGDPMCFLAR